MFETLPVKFKNTLVSIMARSKVKQYNKILCVAFDKHINVNVKLSSEKSHLNVYQTIFGSKSSV